MLSIRYTSPGKHSSAFVADRFLKSVDAATDFAGDENDALADLIKLDQTGHRAYTGQYACLCGSLPPFW